MDLDVSEEYQMRRVEADASQPYLFQSQDHPPHQFDLFEYFPEFHFQLALNREGYDVETDGGRTQLHNGKKRANVYYWLDPDTDSALYHTEVNGEQSVPFFADEEAASEFLERQAEMNGDNQYSGMSLYKAKARKVKDAKDVLTDQAGLGDFAADDGGDS